MIRSGGKSLRVYDATDDQIAIATHHVESAAAGNRQKLGCYAGDASASQPYIAIAHSIRIGKQHEVTSESLHVTKYTNYKHARDSAQAYSQSRDRACARLGVCVDRWWCLATSHMAR